MNPKTIKTVVHEFFVGDVEDPVIYAADPMISWEKTEKGRWVMENSVTPPVWQRTTSFDGHYRFTITAVLTESAATYYNLRWK